MKNNATAPLFDETPYEITFEATVIDSREDLVAFDRTLFYPAGGGQPGDTGFITHANGSRARVMETHRDDTDRSLIWHRLEGDIEALAVGLTVTGEVDWEVRYDNMKMHTCLHLLCSLIDAPVTGCSMGQGKGRLDFDLPEMTMSKDEITKSLNALIASQIEVETRLISPDHYDAALALVRNRYALPPRSTNSVKMIEVRGVDIQPCGGTHIRNTSEIGQVVCEKIDKKGRQNRRIVLRLVD
ncbi:alanyl-tRNA editing protein [Burkholderia sp. L27(2015)]|uniref:alanyl-tRNA editing protein n=1 Tax=Burkholderia sp. L27(2015) TaxID=1641858 RepID=UPI00131D9138|nr:alanyl-tRNA editing protein [Burkholderia sp. L27(2015)]